MTIETLFGSIALVTSIIGLLPQVVKSIRIGSTRDLSMVMLINYLICSIAWIVYARYTASPFVLLSNVIGFISSVALIIMKKYYDQAV